MREIFKDRNSETKELKEINAATPPVGTILGVIHPRSQKEGSSKHMSEQSMCVCV